MFPVRGGGLSIYPGDYGFWVGNFCQKKNPFGKNLYILILFSFFENLKKIWSGNQHCWGAYLFSAYDWNWKSSQFYIKGYKIRRSLTRFYFVLQKWDFECLAFKGKNRTVKSHLPNAEILIAPRSAQPAASCPEKRRCGAMGWKVLFSLLILLAWEKAWEGCWGFMEKRLWKS